MSSNQENAYVLVSACRNESEYINGLVDAIAAQTRTPVSWIVIDDGSTDDTYARAVERSTQLPFLQVVQMPGGRPRSFTSQVYAALHGYELLKKAKFEYIGFLDTDIRIAPDYYESLLHFLSSNPKLGLCGGAVIDKYDNRIVNMRKGSEDYHVAGGVQFFRRECFEQIGGYLPIDGGGQDTIADIMAMMNGWEVCVFPQLEALHLRPDGYSKDSVYLRGIKWGRKFYLIGYHPLYFLAQSFRRLRQRPMIITSAAQLFGFLKATLKGEKRPVPPEFVIFLRKLQMRRLRKALLPSWMRSDPRHQYPKQ